MKISYIIPCYNSEEYLEKCFKSIINQDVEKSNYEIIIVDDGSVDSTNLLATKLVGNHDNAKIVVQNNKGVGSARNTGMDNAKGEYIFFIDPDDYLVPNVISKLFDLLSKLNVEILEFCSNRVETGQFLSERESMNDSCKVYHGVDYIGQKNYNSHVWAYLFKRTFLQQKEIRFIEGKWMEDIIFVTQSLLSANRVAFTSMDVHRYVKINNSAMNSADPEHLKKIILDMANAVIVFDELINSFEMELQENVKSLKRLKTKQEAHLFFLTVRGYRSTLEFDELFQILEEMRKKGLYPIENFISQDYSSFRYKLINYIFNRKPLLRMSFFCFRCFKNIKQRTRVFRMAVS